MLGAMDPRYCILLTFGILEFWIVSRRGHLGGDYVFVEAGGNPEAAKVNAYNALFNVLGCNEFHKLKVGPLGTHSIQKYGSTMTRKNGRSKDDLDYRSLWNGEKGQVTHILMLRCLGRMLKLHQSFALGGLASSY
jgi:hypothetical protein